MWHKEPSWSGKYQSELSQSKWLNLQPKPNRVLLSTLRMELQSLTTLITVLSPNRRLFWPVFKSRWFRPAELAPAMGPAAWLHSTWTCSTLLQGQLRLQIAVQNEWYISGVGATFLPLNVWPLSLHRGDPLSWSSRTRLPCLTKQMSCGKVDRLQPAWVYSTVFLQKERPGDLKGWQSSRQVEAELSVPWTFYGSAPSSQ